MTGVTRAMTIPASQIKPRDFIVSYNIHVTSVSHLPEFHVRVRYVEGKGYVALPKVTAVTVYRKVQ